MPSECADTHLLFCLLPNIFNIRQSISFSCFSGSKLRASHAVFSGFIFDLTLTRGRLGRSCVARQLLNSSPPHQKWHYCRGWKIQQREGEVKIRPHSSVTSDGCPFLSNCNMYLRQCSLGRSFNDLARVSTPQSPMQFWDTLKAKGKSSGRSFHFSHKSNSAFLFLKTDVMAEPRSREEPNQDW